MVVQVGKAWYFSHVSSIKSKGRVVLRPYPTQLTGEEILDYFSLVLRHYPLMRRNNLVNQVKFLGLVHAFTTV